MENRRPTLFTSFFILAIVALACAFVVSILVMEHKHLEWFFRWLLANLSLTVTLTIIICISSYLIISCLNWVTYRKGVVWTALLLYWISVIILFFPVVDFVVQHFSNKDTPIPLWAMLLMSILLLFIYGLIEQLSLRASGSLTILGFLRLILFQRFTVLGNLIIWLESGWHATAVKFIDVLLAVWLLQSTIRVLWQTTGPESLFSFGYSEIISLTNTSSTWTIFNSFYQANQSNFTAITYTGHNFFLDILSSISSLLLNHWQKIAVIWFLLVAMGFILESSKKLVIVDSSASHDAAAKKQDENGKITDAQAIQPSGSNLADLLALKLDRINQIYRAVDEKRPIQSACGAGEPIEAAIKAENLDNISMSDSSQIGLGPVSIPARSISALVSHILRGPKIVIGLHGIEQDDASDKKSKWLLTASMTGRGGPRSWLVDCPQPLEEGLGEKDRTVDDMITEMAHRIYTSLQSDASGQSVTWRAMWNFNEGLRAYRDCLHSTKRHKYFLSHAEKKLIDALEEQNSFSLAYYNLGVVYAEIGKLKAAEACFLRAIDADPQLWEAYYAQGISVFRGAKEMELQHEILAISMEDAVKREVEDDYRKVILLCHRILDIKSRKEIILGKNFSAKARAHDLEGNARARLACIQCHAKSDEPCEMKQENKSDELWLAKESLERAVQYSWRALIRESVLNETIEDESKIVSECSLDLAYIYLRMYNCPSCEADELLSNAKSVLRQAIYINPDDVNLYHLLGEVSKRQKDGDHAELIYNHALRINPESSSLKAHLASIGVIDNTGPAAWLEELEKPGCVDEMNYEKTFHFLEKAIEEERDFEKDDSKKYDSLARKPFYEREMLEESLSKISRKGESATSLFQKKKCECKWVGPEICLALFRLAGNFGYKKIDCQCLNIALTYLKASLKIKKHPIDLKALLLPVDNEEERLRLANGLFYLGRLYFELARIKVEKYLEAEDAEECGSIETNPDNSELIMKSEDFPELSRDCFLSLIIALERETTEKDTEFTAFYKREWSNYLLESGKMLLELGEIERSEEFDSISECFQNAKMAFKRAKEILEEVDPEEIRRSNLGMWLAKAYQGCRKHHKALKEAQKARDLNPLDHEVRTVLGDIFCDLKEFRFGLSELENALSCKPDDPDLLLKAGRAYLSAGKDCRKKGADRDRILEKAKKHLDEALEIEDRSNITSRGKIRYFIGRTLLEMGRYEEAIPHMRILAKEGENPLPSLYLGYVYLKCNDHEESERLLRELIRRLDPDDNKNYVKSGRFYGREYGEKRDINEILARAYIYLAYSYVERDANIYDAWKLACKSRSFIEKMKDENKDVNDLSNDISFVNVCYGMIYGIIIDPAYYGAGQSQDCCIRIVFDRNDWHRKRKAKAHLAECAGAICYKTGKIDEAIDYLNASIALYPDAGAYLNLAKAKERKILCGNVSKSKKALISREIQELCLHVEALDIREEYKNDLGEFKKHLGGKESDAGNPANAKPSAKEV
jgi:tetratricopeptide (TPR) repeat protein